MVSELPSSGVIIAHRGCLNDSIVPNKNQLIVCLQADWDRHPYAQVHVVQNPFQIQLEYTPKIDRYFIPRKSFFIGLWPQTGLKKRDKGRGVILKHIAYFGREINLASELKTENWGKFLSDNGVKWSIIKDPSKWRDYTDVDATISIRNFDITSWYFKPVNKLFNSWIAGVITICGPESAYIAERKDTYNCIIVESYEELKKKITSLLNDSGKLRQYFEMSVEKSNSVTNQMIVNDWAALIDNELRKELHSWRGSSGFYRYIFIIIRLSGYRIKKIRNKYLPENY